MDSLKVCNLCGCDSNETAIFSCTYAKGELQICLECLSEGIIEITKGSKQSQQIKPDIKRNMIDDETINQPLNIEGFDLTVPEEVFGFACEGCGNVMFSNNFPVSCECGHINNEYVLTRQDLMNSKNQFSNRK